MDKSGNIPCESCGADLALLGNKSGSSEINPLDSPKALNPINFHAASSSKLSVKLVNCNECDLKQVFPMPDEGLVVQAYTNADSNLHSNQETYRIYSFTKAVKKLRKLRLKDAPSAFLDIGCSSGDFLRAMIALGHEVHGIEPSIVLSEIARKKHNLNVVNGTFGDAELSREKFDVVSLWDVLEHLNSPKGTLNKVTEVLNPEGYLILNLPMVDTFPAKIMGKFWPFYLDVHLYYFTLKTIQKIAKDAGFVLVEKKRYWQTLSLGYLLQRQFQWTHLRIPRIPLRYYLGQRTLLFRFEK